MLEEQLSTNIIDFLPDPTFAVNLKGEVIVWNKAMEKMTGIAKSEIIGQGDYSYALPFYQARRPALLDMLYQEELEYLKGYENIERHGDMLYGELFSPHIYRGRGAFLWIVAAPLYNSNGERIGAIETIRDITDRRKMEAELQFLSFHDFLTKLYNRSYFEQEMFRLDDDRYNPVGVMVCDLDGLKMVNDTLGHDIGDLLLTKAAQMIKNCFRKGDMVARVGGDEFAILLPNCTLDLLEKKYHTIKEAALLHTQQNPEKPIYISIGYALKNGEINSLREAYKVADDNMYREKMLSGKSYRNNIVDALMLALETRDYITEGHAIRLQKWVINLAAKAGLSEERNIDLLLFAQFHDIGKVGVSDTILFKPGPLTSEEKIIMERHSEMGFRIASAIPELVPIADWILRHHEWWNGQGYPFGLQGEEIPIECRILAIADAYDAMTSDRPYRKALSNKQAIEELQKFAGIQFDPLLVSHFIELLANME